MVRYCAAALIGLALLGVGCGKKPPPQIITKVETQEVKVPVPVKVAAPDELLAPLPPLQLQAPTFVAPTDPQASSALTAEGERLLRALVAALLESDALLRARLQAWAAWASLPAPEPPTR